MYRYRLQGYSLSVPGRVIRMTVNARNVDDARRVARIRNADFGATIQTPRKVGRIVELDCAHETVIDQERIDGIFYGRCRDCHEDVSATGDEYEDGSPSWEPTDKQFATYRGVTVEVAS